MKDENKIDVNDIDSIKNKLKILFILITTVSVLCDAVGEAIEVDNKDAIKLHEDLVNKLVHFALNERKIVEFQMFVMFMLKKHDSKLFIEDSINTSAEIAKNLLFQMAEITNIDEVVSSLKLKGVL